MANLIAQKAALRKLMKETLKQISVEEKQRQTNAVLNYLLNKSEYFKQAKHVALYLAMKSEEIDTIPLIEELLIHKEKHEKRIYVPYVEMKTANATTIPQMVFYELESIQQYNEEMNDNNRFKLRQFNDVSKLSKADETLFDLVIVPGLAFDLATKSDDLGGKISRMGRGKGYYDVFLAKIPQCYTLAIGFNQQYLPLNESLKDQVLPYDEARDKVLNDFVCEKLVS